MLRAIPRVVLITISLIASGCGTDSSSSPAGADHGHSHGDALPLEQAEAELVAATSESPAYLRLGPGVEVVGDVATAVRGESSTFTHEGHFAPLLFGTDLRAFSLRLVPGMFLAEHPHPTESMVYTVSGRWVLCSGGNRKVMEPGSLFHFGPDAPTGWEAPFADEAQLLIVKTIREGEDYAMFCEGMKQLAERLQGRYAEGEVFYFHQLEEDHPAIAFAREQGAPIDQVREGGR